MITTKTRLTFFLLSPLGLALSTGCHSKECTLAGCVPTVAVAFAQEIPPGEYRVVVEIPDETLTCTVTLHANGTNSDCPSEAPFHLFADRLVMHIEPEEATLELTHVDEGTPFRKELNLDYETTYPNGEECGNPCRSAATSFDTESLVEAINAWDPGLGGSGTD